MSIAGAPAHQPADFEAGAEMLRALAHPARLRIAVELNGGDRCVHELVEILGLAQPTVSQHLRVLRSARLVRGRRVGREIKYSLADHHVGHIAIDALVHAGEPSPPDTDNPDYSPTDERTTP